MVTEGSRLMTENSEYNSAISRLENEVNNLKWANHQAKIAEPVQTKMKQQIKERDLRNLKNILTTQKNL